MKDWLYDMLDLALAIVIEIILIPFKLYRWLTQ